MLDDGVSPTAAVALASGVVVDCAGAVSER